jgi:hypothetical protein
MVTIQLNETEFDTMLAATFRTVLLLLLSEKIEWSDFSKTIADLHAH